MDITRKMIPMFVHEQSRKQVEAHRDTGIRGSSVFTSTYVFYINDSIILWLSLRYNMHCTLTFVSLYKAMSFRHYGRAHGIGFHHGVTCMATKSTQANQVRCVNTGVMLFNYEGLPIGSQPPMAFPVPHS